MYTTEGRIKEPNLSAEADQGLLSTGLYLKSDEKGTIKGPTAAEKGSATEITKHTRTSPADAICWSGCKDNQTSKDTVEEGKHTGAMSYVSICHISSYQSAYNYFLFDQIV